MSREPRSVTGSIWDRIEALEAAIGSGGADAVPGFIGSVGIVEDGGAGVFVVPASGTKLLKFAGGNNTGPISQGRIISPSFYHTSAADVPYTDERMVIIARQDLNLPTEALRALFRSVDVSLRLHQASGAPIGGGDLLATVTRSEYAGGVTTTSDLVSVHPVVASGSDEIVLTGIPIRSIVPGVDGPDAVGTDRDCYLSVILTNTTAAPITLDVGPRSGIIAVASPVRSFYAG